MITSKLDAKIQARNENNRIAMAVYDALIPVFTPYLGKKIQNQDGSFIAKLRPEIEKALAPLKAQAHQIWCNTYPYSLSFCVKTCKNFNGGGYYDECSVYIADMQGADIKRLYDRCERKTDFRAEDIIAARAEVTRTRTAYQNAESALAGFGEYDN